MRAIGEKLLDDAERTAFVANARGFMGVRFRHQGRTARGLDCVGLCLASLAPIRPENYDAGAYSRYPQQQGLRAAIVRNLGEPVPKESMREGDVALMTFVGEPSHVGIVTSYPDGGFAVLHTFAQVKRVVEHRMDETWLGYITEIFRP